MSQPDNLCAVQDNTKEWGPFFLWSGSSYKRAFPLAPIWIREIDTKDRFGFGIRVRLHRLYAIGIWGKAPRRLAAYRTLSETGKRSYKLGRNVRQPGMNALLYRYYGWKEKHILVKQQKEREKRAATIQYWIDHLEEFAE